MIDRRSSLPTKVHSTWPLNKLDLELLQAAKLASQIVRLAQPARIGQSVRQNDALCISGADYEEAEASSCLIRSKQSLARRKTTYAFLLLSHYYYWPIISNLACDQADRLSPLNAFSLLNAPARPTIARWPFRAKLINSYHSIIIRRLCSLQTLCSIRVCRQLSCCPPARPPVRQVSFLLVPVETRQPAGLQAGAQQ